MRRAPSLLLSLALLGAACNDTIDVAPTDGGGGHTSVSTGGAGGDGGAGGNGGAPPTLPDGVYAFDGQDQTLPAGDLAPFGAMVEGATLVGLGESVHTSGGFLELKARLIRYLVSEHGYRVLAMETPHTAAESVGAYVDTCAGNATIALHGIFPVFASTSTRDLVEWLCQYNADHPDDPVAFIGFDAQQPWDDIPALQAFLGSAAPADAPQLLGGLSSCDGFGFASQDDYYNQGGFTSTYPADAYQACLPVLDAIDAYVDANAGALAAATSPAELERARIASIGLRSWQHEKFFYGTDDGKASEARDVAMAAILERELALDFPGRKAIVFAHNYHITERHDQVDEPGEGPVLTTGTVLKQHLGDGYRAFALIGNDVDINWPGVGIGDTDPPSPGSVEDVLHALGPLNLIVDLHAPGLAALITPGQTYEMGAPTPSVMVPAEQFRAAFYLDASPMMEPLFW